MPEPRAPSVATAASGFQPGREAGSWARPNGAIKMAAAPSWPIESWSGEREEDDGAHDQSPEHDDRWRELADADLDEEERRSPDRGEGDEEDHVASAHAGLTLTVGPPRA